MDNILGRYSLTLIDSLDSLAVMGLKEEFQSAINFVASNVTFDTGMLFSLASY
jgi:hypothetical protein